MNKSIYFSGQPIFSQLLKLLPKQDIAKITAEYQADRYTKKFTTWQHLVTMLYASYQQCETLREVVTGLHAQQGKLFSIGMNHHVRRSTFAEANQKRSSDVFEAIFYKTYFHLRPFFPDSRLKNDIFRKLIIIDSTTISLFKEILKAAGNTPANGKRKGGVKVHMAIKAIEDVPHMALITAAAAHDTRFLKYLNPNKGSYIVFDKGYWNFDVFHKWNKNQVYWVTRLRENTQVEVVKDRLVSESQRKLGVQRDQNIIIGGKNNKKVKKVSCRLITYYDQEKNHLFRFICNNKRIKPATVAAIYKQRWQIELLFKRLKQNQQLRCFLGDNENAIRIQIWCALIADLLLKAATCGIKKSWSFSNLSGFIRHHLMTYTRLQDFLNDPDKIDIYKGHHQQQNQLQLFSSA